MFDKLKFIAENYEMSKI